jgi:SAM-dependent methyltransferase
MQRTLEPELMDEFDQARAYAAADFAEPNERFVGYCGAEPGFPARGAVLDLGCGPGDIVLRLARRHPELTVHGLDGSAAMLRFAADSLAREPSLQSRVQFVHGVLPGVALPLPRYDAVVSNSLLHHLHDPAVLWNAIRETGAPGAVVVVMDLFRPPSPGAAQEIVDAYAGEEPEVLQRDFYNSLCAAFEPGEVRAQLDACGLGGLDVRTVSDRHLLVAGRLPG